MRLLFIHEVSYRKKVIFEMHELPELLSLRGHQVSFMEFDEDRRFWSKEKAPRFEDISGRVHAEASVKLYRPFQLGIPGVDRLLALFTAIPLLHKILKNGAFDAVVLYAVPTFGLQALWFARRIGVPVFFRALDASHKIRSSIFSPVIKLVEKILYKNVDLISANNSAMASYCTTLGKRTKQTMVHFPPLDLVHFQKFPRDPFLRQSLGFTEQDRVLVYMGSFFYFSGLLDALREFEKISKQDSGVRLLLIGGGEQDQALRKLSSELGLENRVVFTGFIKYEDLPRYLKVADIALNTLEPNLVASVAFPNKVLQYLAAGLPVVSTRLNGLYSVFKDENSIAWAEDAATAVRTAWKLNTTQQPAILASADAQSALVKFSPAEVVNRFESDLITFLGACTS